MSEHVDPAWLSRRGLPWAEHVARRLCSQCSISDLMDELVAEGQGALVDIARRFDPARSSFESYAKRRMRFAMLDHLRKRASTRRRAHALLASMRLLRGCSREVETEEEIPPSEAAFRHRFVRALTTHTVAMIFGLGASEIDPDSSSGTGCPETTLREARRRHKLRSALEQLQDAREREVIRRLYWEGQSVREVAHELGLSPSWVSRLHRKAIERLAVALTDQRPAER